MGAEGLVSSNKSKANNRNYERDKGIEPSSHPWEVDA